MDKDCEVIPVKPIKPPKNLDKCAELPRNRHFSAFSHEHSDFVEKLVEIFMDCKDMDELLSTALYVRDRVNSELFMYCYSIALFHRKDTDNIELPNLMECMPHKFCGIHSMRKIKHKDLNDRTKRASYDDGNSDVRENIEFFLKDSFKKFLFFSPHPM